MSMEPLPVLSAEQTLERLRARRANHDHGFYALYSSWLGGVVTDAALMSIPLDDHLVHRGHGVFDTATLVDGNLYRLEQHLARLVKSADSARIPLPFPPEQLRDIVLQTVAASGQRDGSVRYWLSAGPGDFSFLPNGCIEPCFYVMVYRGMPMDEDGVHKGLKEFTVTDVPMKPRMLATMKSNNYLLNCLTAMDSYDKGGGFGILVEDDGTIAESCVMNVSFVIDGVLCTPKFDNILSGLTVQRVLELGQELVEAGVVKGVEQRSIHVDEARRASEMFLSGGDTRVFPVVEWDGKALGDGKVGPVVLAVNKLIERDLHVGNKYKIPVPYANAGIACN